MWFSLKHCNWCYSMKDDLKLRISEGFLVGRKREPGKAGHLLPTRDWPSGHAAGGWRAAEEEKPPGAY